jgi:F0F1-type ATP synthase membrane subunit b/b'
VNPIDIAHLPIYLLQAHGAESKTLMETLVESNLFNVVLVALILGFLIKKFDLFAGVEGQRSKIAREIEAIELQKREAMEQLNEVKQKTASLTSEVEEILRNAKTSAEGLSIQIVSDARTEASKIVENSKKRVELEQRAAMKELEKRLLNDALYDARSELANNLTAADQKRSVETFLEELSQVKGA